MPMEEGVELMHSEDSGTDLFRSEVKDDMSWYMQSVDTLIAFFVYSSRVIILWHV